MAANRQGTGLVTVRILLGVFLLFEGIAKLPWLLDSGILVNQLNGWLQGATDANRWFLQTVAIPGAPVFARLVMLGEAACGAAFILGAWTRTAAALGFLMVLGFHFSSGALLHYKFLTNASGLPVLAGLLGLAIGGKGLPLSLKP